VLAVAMALMLIGGADQVPEPAPAPSSARVTEAVRRAPPLVIPALPPLAETATFRVVIEGRSFPSETALDAMRRDLAARPTFTVGPGLGATPIVGVDLLGLAMAVGERIAEMRRARAERAAREDVEAELAAFCAIRDCSVVEAGVSPREGVLIPPKPR
jgi:hypothetical protein